MPDTECQVFQVHPKHKLRPDTLPIRLTHPPATPTPSLKVVSFVHLNRSLHSP